MARKVFEANLQELHNDLIRMGSIVEKNKFKTVSMP